MDTQFNVENLAFQQEQVGALLQNRKLSKRRVVTDFTAENPRSISYVLVKLITWTLFNVQCQAEITAGTVAAMKKAAEHRNDRLGIRVQWTFIHEATDQLKNQTQKIGVDQATRLNMDVC